MSKTESFEFLNELALAFRRGEKNARLLHVPILEGVRAVLAHLHSTGRLLAVDEMRLTAELVEDVRIVLGLKGSQDIKVVLDAQVRLRALFPATEPAEVTAGRCDAVSIHADRCFKTFGHDLDHQAFGYTWDSSYPAPAEPAEEETKAEEWQERVADLESQLEKEIGNRDEMEERLTSLIYSLATAEEVGEWSNMNDLDKTFIDHMHSKIRQLERKAASSPVVPAPTETGPWQTWDDVPDGIEYRESPRRGLRGWWWINRNSIRHLADPRGEEDATTIAEPVGPFSPVAPFVAAEGN